MEEVDLQKIVIRNLENFEEIIRMKNIMLTCHCETPVVISMNKTLAEIMITNLISNSIKHNIENGTLTISVNEENISIVNSGHPLHVSPSSLFERFGKSDRSTESVGLGLAIVRQIIDFYSMKIEYRYENSLHAVTIFFY